GQVTGGDGTLPVLAQPEIASAQVSHNRLSLRLCIGLPSLVLLRRPADCLHPIPLCLPVSGLQLGFGSRVLGQLPLGVGPHLGGLQVSGAIPPLPAGPRSATDGSQHQKGAGLSCVGDHCLNHALRGWHSRAISTVASLYCAASDCAIVTAHTALSRSPCRPK